MQDQHLEPVKDEQGAQTGSHGHGLLKLPHSSRMVSQMLCLHTPLRCRPAGGLHSQHQRSWQTFSVSLQGRTLHITAFLLLTQPLKTDIHIKRAAEWSCPAQTPYKGHSAFEFSFIAFSSPHIVKKCA